MRWTTPSEDTPRSGSEERFTSCDNFVEVVPRGEDRVYAGVDEEIWDAFGCGEFLHAFDALDLFVDGAESKALAFGKGIFEVDPYDADIDQTLSEYTFIKRVKEIGTQIIIDLQ